MTILWTSVSVGLAATLLSLPAVIALSWVLERSRSPLRGTVHVAVMLPLVLPPVVTGYLLLRLFSPRGVLGRALESVGVPVAFHWLGAVVAAGVVGLPLFVMQTTQALRAIEPRLEATARTLGLGSWSVFRRVTLPLAWPGILSGALLSFARGLGEFGATLIIAGRIPGETETLSLAIHAELDAPGGEARIAGLVTTAIVVCIVAVVLSRRLERRWRRRLELAR